MSPINILLKTIVTTYFSNSQCLVLINDEINTLNLQLNIPILSISSKGSETFDNLFNYNGCQEFILYIENPVSIFEHIEDKIQLHKARFNRRKYVFVARQNQKRDAWNIFESDKIQYVSDLLVILEEASIDQATNRSIKEPFSNKSSKIFSIWTHNYVGQNNNNKHYMIDKWFSKNCSFLSNRNNLFPDKLKDQHGRVLKAALFRYEPYVIAEPKSDGSYLYMGSEIITILTFAKYHNLTLTPVINEFDYWGEIWDNWTGNGLLGNLVEDRADIGLAALYTWEFAYKYLDLTKPTVRTGITCLVPAPKFAAGWLTPVYVFAPEMWMAVTATFIIILLVVYIYNIIQISMTVKSNVKCYGQNKAEVFEKSIISVSKPFVLQNVTNKEIARGILGSFLMGLVFMTTLLLSTIYDSGLATIMTIPRYENPINTVNEFIESGLHWGGTQDAWILSIKNSKEPSMVELVSRFVATSEENLRKLSLSGKFAFPLERLPKDNYAIGNYIQEDVIQNFHLMTNDFYWEQCVFMLRKSSILLPYVDIFVLKVFEAGLISVWQNQAATQYMNQNVQKAVRYFSNHQKKQGIVKLKMTHVQGAFGILAFGNALAIVVFLIELVYYRLFKKVVIYK